MKALVIEDAKLYQQIIVTILNDLGVEVRFVEDGAGGLQAAINEEYDFLCLDLHLPDISGIEVCEKLRARGETRLLPIILLTAEEDPALLRKAFDAGVTEILFKSGTSELHAAFGQFVKRMSHVYSGRILYIEDSQTTAQIMLHYLEKMRFEVDHYVSAERAFDEFHRKPYDLIITDIVVEGAMSGLGLVRAVRALADDRNRMPILAVSGLDDVARRVEILRMGANDYVSKPIIEEEFAARVGNLITNKQLFDKVKDQQRQLMELAVTDQLTKLYNRHYLAEMAGKYISRAIRHAAQISLLVIDLDHFKAVNDTHGHQAGDQVLAGVGALLKSVSRDEDIAARYGGEEFVLLCQDCSYQYAIKKAEDIRKRVEALHPGGLAITASIGVATLMPQSDSDFSALFARADAAVYRAKANGRNREESINDLPASDSGGDRRMSDKCTRG